MAVSLIPFNADLSSFVGDEFVFETNVSSAFRLGFIAMQLKQSSVDLSDRIVTSQSPVSHGIQENFSIWLLSSAGEDYNTRLFGGGFNGRQSFIWVPESGQNYIFNNGSNLQIRIANRYKFGNVFGNITVDTL